MNDQNKVGIVIEKDQLENLRKIFNQLYTDGLLTNYQMKDIVQEFDRIVKYSKRVKLD